MRGGIDGVTRGRGLVPGPAEPKRGSLDILRRPCSTTWYAAFVLLVTYTAPLTCIDRTP